MGKYYDLIHPCCRYHWVVLRMASGRGVTVFQLRISMAGVGLHHSLMAAVNQTMALGMVTETDLVSKDLAISVAISVQVYGFGSAMNKGSLGNLSRGVDIADIMASTKSSTYTTEMM